MCCHLPSLFDYRRFFKKNIPFHGAHYKDGKCSVKHSFVNADPHYLLIRLINSCWTINMLDDNIRPMNKTKGNHRVIIKPYSPAKEEMFY